MKIKIRLGSDCARKAIMDLRVPLLVSANSLWDKDRRRFCGYRNYQGQDIALDSSGFVAMKLYGGYRWTAAEYAGLVQAMRPTWWAQMDYCCEPEIAGSRSKVESRISQTIDGLQACRAAAQAAGVDAPMPVLQGYEASDYVAGPIFDQAFPALVGVGSVCRRHLRGKHGLLAIIDAIDRRVPRQTALHLFGVKGRALSVLADEFPQREFSADSMAWNTAFRWDAHENGVRKTYDNIKRHATTWLARNQVQESDQLQLTF